MTRWHVNPETGDVGKCRAQTSCPFGDLDTAHYSSKAEARQAYEDSMVSIPEATKRSSSQMTSVEAVLSLGYDTARPGHVRKRVDGVLLELPTTPLGEGDYAIDWLGRAYSIRGSEVGGKVAASDIMGILVHSSPVDSFLKVDLDDALLFGRPEASLSTEELSRRKALQAEATRRRQAKSEEKDRELVKKISPMLNGKISNNAEQNLYIRWRYENPEENYDQYEKFRRTEINGEMARTIQEGLN